MSEQPDERQELEAALEQAVTLANDLGAELVEAQATIERQQQVIDRAQEYRNIQNYVALPGPIRVSPATLDAARRELDEALAALSGGDK